MNFLNLFIKHQNTSKESILNSGLRLLLNAPFNLNEDITERLLKKYPQLAGNQILEYEQLCRQAKKFGHDIIYDSMVKRIKAFDPMTKQELHEFYIQEMQKHFSWVNKRNLKSIYNLASYSLRHDGWYKFK